jgi:hypothetical protein
VISAAFAQGGLIDWMLGLEADCRLISSLTGLYRECMRGLEVR